MSRGKRANSKKSPKRLKSSNIARILKRGFDRKHVGTESRNEKAMPLIPARRQRTATFPLAVSTLFNKIVLPFAVIAGRCMHATVAGVFTAVCTHGGKERV